MINLKLTKIIASSLIVVSVFAFSTIKTQAVTDKQIIVAHEQTVYADSYQWRKEGNAWMCGTPELHQAYYNAWICTNGSWYYVNQYGYMVTDVWVNNYYVNSNGEWIIDAKRNQGSYGVQGLN